MENKNGMCIDGSIKDELKTYFVSEKPFNGELDTLKNIIDSQLKETPKYYNNEKGSLYKFAEDHKLNAWEFDVIKRIVRCRKKGAFKEDLEKTKVVIDLYLKEFEEK